MFDASTSEANVLVKPRGGAASGGASLLAEKSRHPRRIEFSTRFHAILRTSFENFGCLSFFNSDGTIHLAFDHHGELLNYRVSQPGVATDPDNVEWNASLFSDVRDWLKQGERLSNVTYPRFVSTPQGVMPGAIAEKTPRSP